MSGINLDELIKENLAFADDKVDVTGSEVSLDAATLAALENITVSATDLDIRDLTFATDKVDASGSEVSLDAATLAALENITVSATDFDIRDLSHTQDSLKVGDGTDFLAVNADGSINTITAPPEYAAIKNTAETVTTTAAEVLSTPLSGRKEVTIQNEGSQDVYIGSTAGVTSANGIKISKASSATYLIPEDVNIFMVAASGSQDVRFLELG